MMSNGRALDLGAGQSVSPACIRVSAGVLIQGHRLYGRQMILCYLPAQRSE